MDSNPYSQSSQQDQVDCSNPLYSGSPACDRQQISPQTPNRDQYNSLDDSLRGRGINGQPLNYNDNGQLIGPNRQQSGRMPLPPEPLTEFQKFVASTTNQILPIFGASLFQSVPSTFAPLDKAPVPSSYVLGPDDELRVRVWGQVNFTANLRIDRSGSIFLPQIGEVHVAGLSFGEVDQHIRQAISHIYRNFDLTVEMGQIRAIQVYISGEARRPGAYTISSLSTLVDALFASGGPSVQGSMRRIELRREGKTIATFDLYDLLIYGDKSKDAKLLAGDLIFIPAAGPQVAVLGSVRRQAIYELSSSGTIADAIKAAGGLSALASETRVSIERIVEHSGREAMEVALDTAGQATALHGGDILRVIPIVPSYRQTVTLRGNTANPGRFAWHQGMRISDLIPDRESLITRDYWWRRTQLGLPNVDFEPIPNLSVMRQPSTPVDLRDLQRRLAQQRAAYENRLRQRSGVASDPNMPGQNTYDPNNPSSPYNPYDPFNPYDPYAQQSNPLYDPTNPYNGSGDSGQSNDQRSRYTPGQSAGQSALGEPDETGRAPLMPPPSQRTMVGLSVPEIDWSYAVIERMNPDTLKTTLISFDLGKLVLAHDDSQNLELKAGDVVSIFSQNDIRVPIAQQTTLVRLEGEFLHSGTYSVLPGETLRDLIRRVGGFSSDAYLYGSVFTRESTRISQQRRIDETTQNLSMQMERGSLALASSASSNQQEIAGLNSAQAAERDLISQLRLIRATGRIVLEFKPTSQSLDDMPDIPLENGDRFFIPQRPATVNVVGAVFNQNSFLFRNAQAAGAYLKLAGGPSNSADRKHMFIVRADGSVISRTSLHSGPWGEKFELIHLNPGDTVVVPEKTIRPNALRGLIDWTQIFSQLALGAAAINVL